MSNVALDHYGLCGNIGAVKADPSDAWFAAVITPPIYPYTMTWAEVVLLHDSLENCDASAAYALRVFVTDTLALPATQTTAPTPQATASFAALDPSPAERFLSVELDTPVTVTTGQHIVIAIDATRPSIEDPGTCVRTCLTTDALPTADRRSYYSTVADPTQWQWNALSRSKMHFRAVGYYP